MPISSVNPKDRSLIADHLGTATGKTVEYCRGITDPEKHTTKGHYYFNVSMTAMQNLMAAFLLGATVEDLTPWMKWIWSNLSANSNDVDALNKLAEKIVPTLNDNDPYSKTFIPPVEY